MKKLGIFVMPLMAMSLLVNCNKSKTFLLTFNGTNCKMFSIVEPFKQIDKERFTAGTVAEFQIKSDEGCYRPSTDQVVFSSGEDAFYNVDTGHFSVKMTSDVTVTAISFQSPKNMFPQSVVDPDSDLAKKLDGISVIDDHGYKTDSEGNFYYSFKNLTSYVSDSNISILKDSITYYKVEPINWIELEKKDGKKLCLSEKILTACLYKKKSGTLSNEGEVSLNNYKESDVREYLNTSDGFLWQANLNPGNFAITEVDNSLASTGDIENPFICDNTNDRVFLLSNSEMTKYFANQTDRLAKTTDFARANLVFYDSNNNYGDYWSRTPSNATWKSVPGNYVKMCNTKGQMPATESYFNGGGIRPAYWASDNSF